MEELIEEMKKLVACGIKPTYSEYMSMTKEEKTAYRVASIVIQEVKKIDLIDAIQEAVYPDKQQLRLMQAKNRFLKNIKQ